MSEETPILKDYQILYNFIRTYEGLDGKTPAEACGIKVEGLPAERMACLSKEILTTSLEVEVANAIETEK